MTIFTASNGSLTSPLINGFGTFTTTTYARFDPTRNPSPVTGWFDFDFHAYDVDPATVAPMPEPEWSARMDQDWQVKDGAVVALVPPPPTTQEIVASILSALASVRYTHEIAGYSYDFGDGPKVVPTDRDSQAKLNAAFVMASNGYWQDGTPWKLQDGSFVPMTKAKIMEVAVLASAHVAQCYGVEAQKAAAIAQATDPTSVDINSGWPT